MQYAYLFTYACGTCTRVLYTIYRITYYSLVKYFEWVNNNYAILIIVKLTRRVLVINFLPCDSSSRKLFHFLSLHPTIVGRENSKILYVFYFSLSYDTSTIKLIIVSDLWYFQRKLPVSVLTTREAAYLVCIKIKTKKTSKLKKKRERVSHASSIMRIGTLSVIPGVPEYEERWLKRRVRVSVLYLPYVRPVRVT